MCLIRFFNALNRYADGGFIRRKYLLSDYDEYHESMQYVPEDSIYVEEWVKGNEVRRRLLYEGDRITQFTGNPFARVKTPWTWIGDASTDVDITTAVDRYMMVGNRIELDLLFRFLRMHNDLKIVYQDASSGVDVVFPNEGIRIVADESV
jgi:hypothetical protein